MAVCSISPKQMKSISRMLIQAVCFFIVAPLD
jgi:hypothetical protein